MSFIGAINDKCRKFFATHAKLLEGRDVYNGCSGNFSLEQIPISPLRPFRPPVESRQRLSSKISPNAK